jgi:hypothetical protein
MLRIGNETVDIVDGDGQMEHDKRVIFFALPETPVVVGFSEGHLAFHLFGKTHARAGLRRCVRFDRGGLTDRVTIFFGHAGSFLSFVLVDSRISRKPISWVKIGS